MRISDALAAEAEQAC